MTVVVVVCGVLLTLGAACAVVRAERGPSMLDRTVALDIVVTTMIAAVALYAAVQRRTDVVPVLVVLSLVGFVGSVTISRFAAVEPEGEGRVRTREEVAAEEAARLRAEDEAIARRLAGDDDADDEPEPYDTLGSMAPHPGGVAGPEEAGAGPAPVGPGQDVAGDGRAGGTDER